MPGSAGQASLAFGHRWRRSLSSVSLGVRHRGDAPVLSTADAARPDQSLSFWSVWVATTLVTGPEQRARFPNKLTGANPAIALRFQFGRFHWPGRSVRSLAFTSHQQPLRVRTPLPVTKNWSMPVFLGQSGFRHGTFPGSLVLLVGRMIFKAFLAFTSHSK